MPNQTAVSRTLSDRFKGLATSPPSRRNVKVGVLIGLIAGIFGGFVKLGWEVVFPPGWPAVPLSRPCCYTSWG